MSGSVLQVRSLRWVRWFARARAIAIGAVVLVLSLAGLRSLIAGPPAPTRIGSGGGYDATAAAFAESFARTYLSWDSERPEERERALAGLVSASLDPGAGLEPGGRSRQDVLWTAVLAARRTRRARIVTVAAQTTGGVFHLSVPVARDDRGFLFVSAYPALVGAPPTAPDAPVDEAPEVEDPDLRVVAERVVRNYLERQASDLRADLAPEAVVSLPARRLRVEDVEAVRDLGGSRVAVELRALGGGVSWRLRYELAVVKRERWYVRSIQSNPPRRKT